MPKKQICSHATDILFIPSCQIRVILVPAVLEHLVNYFPVTCYRLCARVHQDTLDPPVKYQVTIALIAAIVTALYDCVVV